MADDDFDLSGDIDRTFIDSAKKIVGDVNNDGKLSIVETINHLDKNGDGATTNKELASLSGLVSGLNDAGGGGAVTQGSLDVASLKADYARLSKSTDPADMAKAHDIERFFSLTDDQMASFVDSVQVVQYLKSKAGLPVTGSTDGHVVEDPEWQKVIAMSDAERAELMASQEFLDVTASIKAPDGPAGGPAGPFEPPLQFAPDEPKKPHVPAGGTGDTTKKNPMDLDGNGQVTQAEVNKYNFQKNGPPSGTGERGNPLPSQLKPYDTDGDGRLSPSERDVWRAENAGGTTPPTLKETPTGLGGGTGTKQAPGTGNSTNDIHDARPYTPGTGGATPAEYSIPPTVMGGVDIPGVRSTVPGAAAPTSVTITAIEKAVDRYTATVSNLETSVKRAETAVKAYNANPNDVTHEAARKAISNVDAMRVNLDRDYNSVIKLNPTGVAISPVKENDWNTAVTNGVNARDVDVKGMLDASFDSRVPDNRASGGMPNSPGTGAGVNPSKPTVSPKVKVPDVLGGGGFLDKTIAGLDKPKTPTPSGHGGNPVKPKMGGGGPPLNGPGSTSIANTFPSTTAVVHDALPQAPKPSTIVANDTSTYVASPPTPNASTVPNEFRPPAARIVSPVIPPKPIKPPVSAIPSASTPYKPSGSLSGKY